MKMREKILPLVLATSVLILSFTTFPVEKNSSSGPPDKNSPDTSEVNRWIRVDSFNLSIIPPSSGVQFYRDGIVFLSSAKYEEKMIASHLSFGRNDALYAELKDNKLDNPKVFSADKPFTYPSEAITFTSDYNTMYFTKSNRKEGTEKIYQAKYFSGSGDKGNWSVNESPLNFCTDGAVYTHPALSPDGKLMIFASNRQGSIGGMDLYASQEKGGSWSEPVNLGDAVNSTANELYPFLDSENNLYFSSDGAQGYGGYDIYVCRFKKNTWEKPINLSLPVNTRFDDVAFTISRKDGKSAFYTVKQNSGKSYLQLYQITMSGERPDTLLTLSQYFTRPDISQMVILVLEPAVQATDKVSATASTARSDKDVITYRVQFMTSFNPRTRPQITVNNVDYPVFDYLYAGAYRLCVGEFSTLSPAIELQNLLRKNSYPQATVLAFKNNVLSLDPELLKQQPGAVQATETAQPKAVETVTAPKTEPEVKKTETAPVQQTTTTKPAVAAAATVPAITATTAATTGKKDVVVYRVQIATNSAAKGSYKITLGGKAYDTFEYQYAGAYRTCVGEFSVLSGATEFQKICRANGYPQAFLVAFKNNVRSTDAALFK